MPRRACSVFPRFRLLSIGVTAIALLAVAALPVAAAAVEPVTITNYTDRSEGMGWGLRSHWMQPWRSYLDTVPGSTLRSAVGINFNVAPKIAAQTARLLAEDGFHRARVEIGWNSIDYEDPTHLSELGQKNLDTYMKVFRENGIRPLILLNSNDGQPCPVKLLTLHLTSPAAAGATEIHLSPADVPEVVPGRTGIPFKGHAAFQLIEAIDANGNARLSTPLRTSYPSGELKAETLRYEPFSAPLLPSGEPNPRFEETMAGWLNYVGVVTKEAKRVLGSEDFDVEIWNELSFGSAFLNINNYYQPDLETGLKTVQTRLLDRTIDYLRDPTNGVSQIGIGNGFANQRPWDNGTESPLGLSAIDKHPYAGWESYPTDAQVNGNRPLNGLGEPSGWLDGENQYHETFTPTYDAFFPERFLSGLHTETLVHDLAPYSSTIAHVAHGRYTHPEGGAPPTMWVTEVNMNPAAGPTPASQMSAADVRHVETKEVLRYLTAYVNKGVQAIDIFAASAGNMSVVDKPFLRAVNNDPSTYPGGQLGGETVEAVRRLTEAMKGFAISTPRSLELRSLTDYNSNVQFAGDPADPTDFPPLYNRDVFAFFPFQTTDTKFVIPVYVMTRNVVEDYRPNATTDPTRFDLPEERYELEIGGVDGIGATVSAFDPITGASTPVEVVSAGEDEIDVDVDVTDSPRLLTIEEQGPSSTEPEAGDPMPVGIGSSPLESVEPPLEPPEEEAGEEGEGPAHGEEGASPEEPATGEGEGERPEEPLEAGGSSPSAGPRRLAAVSDAVEPGDTSPTVAIRLVRPQALLRTRRLRVSGRCTPSCRLLLAARLISGPGRPYRMFLRRHASAHPSIRPTIMFGISPRAAKIARQALRDGAKLKVVVSGRAEQGGRSNPVASRIALGP